MSMFNIPTKEDCQRILDIMTAADKPMTAGQIAEKIDSTAPAVGLIIKRLIHFGAICAAGEIKIGTNKSKLYAIKPRLENAAPYRSKTQEGNLTGVDWDYAMSRPGCQDHLRHPSRRGNRLVMHGERMA